jgi:hypothetical protein
MAPRPTTQPLGDLPEVGISMARLVEALGSFVRAHF